MSLRVAYWTSAFEVDMEAIASEVAQLRNAFPGSVIWGIGPPNGRWLSWRKGFRFHPRLYWPFLAVTRLLQVRFDIQHLFGGVNDWYHLKAVRARPVVLTAALPCLPGTDIRLLRKVDRFVVEWPGGASELERLGISADRIRLIYPPVDTQRFSPMLPPQGPFTVLFASSPQPKSWLVGRGLRILLEAASLRPHMRFRLIWRPWGDSLQEIRSWIESRGLANVELIVGRLSNMPQEYQRAHVTTAPFTDGTQVKPVPNSILESLACGRPVAITSCVGVADIVKEAGAGVVCVADGAALAEALDCLQTNWAEFSARASRLAKERFSLEAFVAGYRCLYHELCVLAK